MISSLLANPNVVCAAWDLGTFLTNSKTTIQNWGGLFIMLLGVIMVVAAVYQAAKGLISPQKSQTNWLLVVCLFIAGGALSIGGYQWVSNIAQGGKKTIDDLGGGGVILPMLQSFFH